MCALIILDVALNDEQVATIHAFNITHILTHIPSVITSDLLAAPKQLNAQMH